ncbi:MAG: sulfatase-like hydrolase/transferase, partial [Deltaproteobacteria bacterium]|nr:sulfatase-like hydrolase/transferase [Deltaproteobacteria bacterium]
AVSVVFIRGGLQTKPLSIKNAFANEKTELGVLTLNGVYTTFNTLFNARDDKRLAARLKSLKPAMEIDIEGIIVSKEREENTPGYPLFRTFRYKEPERRRLNVVIFVMESWSAKFMRSLGGAADASPFFDTLAKDGLLLTNCFANAQRSYEGLSASLGSLPVWKGMALDQGGLLYQTRLEPVGQVFKGYGYETYFVHGARPGSMGFDGLVRRLGIQRHITRDDFKDRERTDDGVWGIYDEYAFLRAHEEFEKAQNPFFAVVYSLTSHTPYRVPSKEFEYFGRETGNREFLNAMRYSDYALRKFFEKARGGRYFKDTLFVIIGDHTEGFSTSNSLHENYRIPCLFYNTGAVSPGRDGMAVSQTDIVPTIFDILKIPAHYTSWGKSIFSPGARKALLPRGDHFVWVSEPYMLITDLDSPAGLYDYTKDPARNLLNGGGSKAASADALQDELLQYLKFSYSLVLENRIRPPQ